jgi:tight adherence protein C
MDLNLTITVVAVFVAVGLFAWTVGNAAIEHSSPTRRRLNALAGAGDDLLAPAVSGARSILRSTLVPKSPNDQGQLGRRLTMAGFHHASAASWYWAAQFGLAVLLFALPLLFLGQASGLVPGLFGGVVGYMTPGLVLDRRISQRRLRIDNGLPDALDLLIVSLEAGLALDQAILKCSEELFIAHPDLAEELRLVNVETRAGKPRIEAFKNFATRTKVEDVRALVAMLVQTDRFGTSVAKALRTHAEVSRTKRRQRAEERAAKIGVKLVFPLVFCLFPAFYVVTLGPAIIKFVHAFGSGGFTTGAELP